MTISRLAHVPPNRRQGPPIDDTGEPPVDMTRVIDAAYIKARRAQRALHAYIALACPGPHRPVQHRDRRPPWCHACGYTTTGVPYRMVDRNGR